MPLKLRVHPPTFTVVLDRENFKCRDYYGFLIKFKYEKPKEWAKIGEEFHLEDNCISEAFSDAHKSFQRTILKIFSI